MDGRSDDRLYGGTVATAPEPESVLLPGHDVPLGSYTPVRRLLPQREARNGEPRFDHHAHLPVRQDGDATVTVLVGRFGSAESPAVVHTPLVGVEVVVHGPGSYRFPLEPTFEYGLLSMSGAVDAAGTTVTPGSLLYLAPGRSELTIETPGEARAFLLGGEPFEEELVMWWNFVGRSHEEVVQAREDWMAGRRFGRVSSCSADPLPAPALPTVRLKARDRHGHTSG